MDMHPQPQRGEKPKKLKSWFPVLTAGDQTRRSTREHKTRINGHKDPLRKNI